MNLKEIIEILELYIYEEDITVSDVSQVWTYRHIDHSLRVIIGMIEALEWSDPKTYVWKFHFVRYLVLITWWIPRWKAQAPKEILHNDEITQTSLIQLYKNAIKKLEVLPSIDKKQYFTHFEFWKMKREETIRMMKVHTRHHIKIIRDILT